jgi:hypothetical protein
LEEHTPEILRPDPNGKREPLTLGALDKARQRWRKALAPFLARANRDYLVRRIGKDAYEERIAYPFKGSLQTTEEILAAAKTGERQARRKLRERTGGYDRNWPTAEPR